VEKYQQRRFDEREQPGEAQRCRHARNFSGLRTVKGLALQHVVSHQRIPGIDDDFLHDIARLIKGS